MANRNTLHEKHLRDFSEWLTENGWSVEETKGDYEVLRARKGKAFMPVYKRDDGKHLSFPEKFNSVIRKFLNKS